MSYITQTPQIYHFLTGAHTYFSYWVLKELLWEQLPAFLVDNEWESFKRDYVPFLNGLRPQQLEFLVRYYNALVAQPYKVDFEVVDRQLGAMVALDLFIRGDPLFGFVHEYLEEPAASHIQERCQQIAQNRAFLMIGLHDSPSKDALFNWLGVE